MATTLSEVILLPGEEVQFQIEGNAYTDSPNPLVKLIVAIFRFIGKLFGSSFRTYLVITNKRVIRVDKEKSFWVIPRNTSVRTIAKSAIREVGYAQAVRWFVFKTLYFQMQTVTENTSIAYQGSLKDVNDLVTKVSELIAL
jgi:hypothetical protein